VLVMMCAVVASDKWLSVDSTSVPNAPVEITTLYG